MRTEREIRARIMKLRTGRKVGRTIYLQRGDEPSDDDLLVGMMDTVELAEVVVSAVNQRRENESR